MTNCEKAETFFKEMATFELYATVEAKYWQTDNDNMTADRHSYAVKRVAESKTRLYNLLMGE
jgi:hypothetical protein|tara:strand:- start:735 stop:920 length:186 start_codon:yes stop_codon:yes gene_type:complete